jgi:hypothetical protein
MDEAPNPSIIRANTRVTREGATSEAAEPRPRADNAIRNVARDPRVSMSLPIGTEPARPRVKPATIHELALLVTPRS